MLLSRRLFVVALVSLPLLVATHRACAATALQTFLVLSGYPPFNSTDVPKLAKYDLLAVGVHRANQIPFAGKTFGTWDAIRAVNPNTKIFLYKTGFEQANWEDREDAASLGSLGRYNVSRGHSMGSLNGNQTQFFLKDASGRRIYNAAYSSGTSVLYVLDFGNALYAKYWLEGISADVVGKPWAANGLMVDGAYPIVDKYSYSATPVKYPTDSVWWAGMEKFIAALGTGLRARGQIFWCNMGNTRDPVGNAAWRSLDQKSLGLRPDIVLEEGAFVAAWGPGQAQFFEENQWKQQVELLRTIRNYKLAFHSHTNLDGVQTTRGFDANGKAFDFWQALWYSVGSFLLGRNDVLNNAYFMFSDDNYDRLWWFDEYERIDLGKALGDYQVKVVTNGGKAVNVYWRNFQRGYVFVNPNQTTDVVNVALPSALRQLTHSNLKQARTTLPVVTSIARLRSHEAAIFLK